MYSVYYTLSRRFHKLFYSFFQKKYYPPLKIALKNFKKFSQSSRYLSLKLSPLSNVLQNPVKSPQKLHIFCKRSFKFTHLLQKSLPIPTLYLHETSLDACFKNQNPCDYPLKSQYLCVKLTLKEGGL